MQSDIKYSVIIPVYNAEKTIERCLSSLIEQNRKDVEIIVINDGSQDSSDEIIRKYVQNNSCITYIKQENAGVSVARNRGLDAATGKYITFVDSDDYVTEDYFSSLEGCDAKEDTELLLFSRNTIGAEDEKATQLFEKLSKANSSTERLKLLIFSRRIMPPWDKRFCRNIIEENNLRFVENMSIGEDFNFCLSYAMCCETIDIIKNKIYCVDITDMSSLSRKYRSALEQQILEVFYRAEKTIKHSKYFEECSDDMLEILDYLFVKNVFACISEEFKIKEPCYFRDRDKIAQICQKFASPLGDITSYCNIIHKGLRFLLKHQIIFPIYAVAYVAKWKIYKKYLEK